MLRPANGIEALKRPGLLGMLLVALAIFLLDPAVSAQAIEHVHDSADALPAGVRARIEGVGQRLMAERQIPIAVLTVESLAAEGAEGATVLEFADGLFQHPLGGFDTLYGLDWTFGIFLVRSVKDNATTVRFGVGWRSEDQARLEQVSRDAMVPYFSQGRHARGIAAAAEAWEQFVRDTDPQAPSYWDRFVLLEKDAVGVFIRQLKSPSRGGTYFFPWVVIPFLLWELARPWRKKQKHRRKQIGVDIFYTVFNQCLLWAFFGTAVCGITSHAFDNMLAKTFGVETLMALDVGGLPVWVQYVLIALLSDFCGYWIHRLLHKVDFLWEIHKVHHSARELDVFNSLRQHFGEIFLYQLLSYIPLAMIGFSVADIIYTNVFLSVFSFSTHANVRVPLGPLRYIFNNPQLHIWHHTVDVHDRGNVNYGDAFSLWDFLFGTGYAPPEQTGQVLGFEDIECYPTTFLGQVVAPFKGIYRNATERLSAR